MKTDSKPTDSNGEAVPGDRASRGQRLLFSLSVIVVILAAGVGGWLLGARSQPKQARAVLPTLGQAPQYKLTNQLGQPVSSEQFRGKIQVVTFLFPYCTTYCPLIAAHLVGFEHTLARAGLQNKVAIVAFDVDPVGTGPAQMRAFLKEYGWNPRDRHWQYLTGKPREIRHVVTDGFHVAYQKVSDNAPQSANDQDSRTALTPQPTVVNPLAEKASPGYDITHNDGLEIIDQQGRIRRLYDDADVVSNQQLMRVVKALLPKKKVDES